MATKAKRSVGRDRGRISSEKYEIAYAAKKLGGRGAPAKIRKAKRALGRKTSRAAIMRRARG